MIQAFGTYVILPLLAIGMVLTLVRLLKGPHVADRVVALDLLVVLGMGIIVTYAIVLAEQALLDVSLILALIGFLSTVGFARYLEKRGR
jgi:multicomponent Na+:H+ antiporter subunit F